MTKARDLANIISGGFTVSDLPTLTASEIPNLDASKITTGSIADARIPASAVSQHATSFDDNKIVNDISTLAIRQASNENKGAYNTNSMYVDVFQDNTGYTNGANTVRSSDEYVSTLAPGALNNSYTDFSSSNFGSVSNWAFSGNNLTINKENMNIDYKLLKKQRDELLTQVWHDTKRPPQPIDEELVWGIIDLIDGLLDKNEEGKNVVYH